jgi:uncharacterized membrane protein YccC
MRGVAIWASNLTRWSPASLLRLPLGTRAQLPALLFALRLSASVCLALCLAFWFQLDSPYWAGTSASIVVQPGLGASLRKGRFRAIGTAVGGLVIVLLVALFPQNPQALLTSLVLWACICGCLATVLSNFASYAAALAGYTTAVVFAGIVDDPQNVFMVAVWRVTEVGIGIVSAAVVHTLTDFGNAGERLARALGEIGQAIAAGLLRTLRTGEDRPELRASRRELIQRVIALRPTLDEAIGEPTHLRSQLGRLQATLESCFGALSAWRGIANHLNAAPFRAKTEAARTAVPALSELANLNWLDAPAAILQLSTAAATRATNTPTSDFSARLLLDGVGGVFGALGKIALTLMLIKNGEYSATPPERPRAHLYVPDGLPVALNALRIAFALSVAALVWVFTAWPQGPRMITFAAVGVILFSARPNDGYSSAIDYAMGTALAGLLATVLNLAVLPGLHGDFLSLAIVLCVTFIPIGILVTGSWHTLAFSALATNLIPILAIQNERGYDATETFNVALAMFAGTAVAAVSLVLLPPLSPARRIARLLTLTLRELRALVIGRRRFTRTSWIGRISRRLEVMPSQATLEDDAQLLAALSVGEAAVSLLELKLSIPQRAALHEAFAEVNRGNVLAGREQLARFAQHHSHVAQTEGPASMSAAIQAKLIADALLQHPHFFGRVE